MCVITVGGSAGVCRACKGRLQRLELSVLQGNMCPMMQVILGCYLKEGGLIGLGAARPTSPLEGRLLMIFGLHFATSQAPAVTDWSAGSTRQGSAPQVHPQLTCSMQACAASSQLMLICCTLHSR